MFVPEGHTPVCASVGACAGVFAQERCRRARRELGRRSARGAAGAGRRRWAAPGDSLASTHTCGSLRGKQFVDLQNDVAGERRRARGARELPLGRAFEALYDDRHGHRPGQDQQHQRPGARWANSRGASRRPVGTTRFRPPFAPVTLGLLVGRRVGRSTGRSSACRPRTGTRRTARCSRISATGAGPPPIPARRDARGGRAARGARGAPGCRSVRRLAARQARDFGPDAAQFLDLMYVGTMSNLRIGQARYGLLLNENGVVMDDGIVARLGEQHYWVNTTSAGVERSAAAFEEWLQCEFTDLEVLVTRRDLALGQRHGRRARGLELAGGRRVRCGAGPASMPHMTMRESTLDGVPLRVLRASFSGELGYRSTCRIATSARSSNGCGRSRRDSTPCRTASRRWRSCAPKRATSTSARTRTAPRCPGDIGFARALERKAANFVGRRSCCGRRARPGRLQLVALLPVGPAHAAARGRPDRRPAAAHGDRRPCHLELPESRARHAGRARHAARGAARLGEHVRVHHLGTIIDAEVVKAPFVIRPASGSSDCRCAVVAAPGRRGGIPALFRRRRLRRRIARGHREPCCRARARPSEPAPAAAGSGECLLAWRSPSETLMVGNRALLAQVAARTAASAHGYVVDQTGGISLLVVGGERGALLLDNIGSSARATAFRRRARRERADWRI